jgi:hypothetical protein
MGKRMKKNPIILFAMVLVFGTGAINLMTEKDMYTINVDIGKNISETAAKSGAPRFGIQSMRGLTFYEILDMPPDIPVQYARRGYEIITKPLFALTMSAFTGNNNSMAVEAITLQFSRHAAKSHDEAQILINDLLSQFSKGKWRRHVDDACPAVTGRSSYLNESDEIDGSCPLDPAYRPTREEWQQLMIMPKYYEWLGDGVQARLMVSFDQDSRGLTYNIELEFQDFAINKSRTAAAHAQKLIAGDKKGWNSTESYRQEIKENQARIKILEANALRRGDHLVARD